MIPTITLSNQKTPRVLEDLKPRECSRCNIRSASSYSILKEWREEEGGEGVLKALLATIAAAWQGTLMRMYAVQWTSFHIFVTVYEHVCVCVVCVCVVCVCVLCVCVRMCAYSMCARTCACDTDLTSHHDCRRHLLVIILSVPKAIHGLGQHLHHQHNVQRLESGRWKMGKDAIF